MRPPRLVPAAAALLVVAAAGVGTAGYARWAETRAVHALAPQMFAQKTKGIALQGAAFRQPDLLPLYGSSDLNVANPYHASAVFRSYPHGFAVFPVGTPGSTSLVWLQALAAVGTDLRGKKLALFLSPRSFMTAMADRHAYAANFSPLHASELAFSPCLDFAVKQAVARRMVQYPATLASEPLLRFALARLADGSAGSRLLYYASWPLGQLYTVGLRLRDHWETWIFLRAQHGMRPVSRHPAVLDWSDVLSRAEQDTRRAAGRNPFGFEHRFWATHAPEIARQKGMYAAQPTERDMARSVEWTDLDLLLRVIRDLGGQPLLLSAPMNGAYYDYLGVPASARRAYYERLRAVGESHGVDVLDFSDHDADPDFTVDPAPHLSSKGWAYYDRALDAFFRAQPPGETARSRSDATRH